MVAPEAGWHTKFEVDALGHHPENELPGLIAEEAAARDAIEAIRAELNEAIEAHRELRMAAEAAGATGFPTDEDPVVPATDGATPPSRREVLQRALKEVRILPFYQPQIGLVSGSLVGFEAQARWITPDRELLMPEVFLPWFERAGLDPEFAIHMVETVLHQTARWRKDGFVVPPVSLPLPAALLAGEPETEALRWILMDNGMQQNDLKFEVAENALRGRHVSRIRHSIMRLSDDGAKISLSGFDVHYEVLRQIRDLPFDEVKLGGDLVAAVGSDPVSEVAVEGLAKVARTLGLTLVAEGIDNASQAEFLRNVGCSVGQGMHFGTAREADLARSSLRSLGGRIPAA